MAWQKGGKKPKPVQIPDVSFDQLVQQMTNLVSLEVHKMARASNLKGVAKALTVDELAELGKTLSSLVRTLQEAKGTDDNDDDLSEQEIARMSEEELKEHIEGAH